MDKNGLAKYIGQLRGRASQATFGAIHKVSRQTVWMWEKGKHVPTEDQLRDMGIKIDYIKEKK